MLTVEEARKLVETKLSEMDGGSGRYCILTDGTIERSWGWAFCWSSVEYARTRDPRKALLGNAAFLVNRETGEFLPSGTAHGLEYYIAKYEHRLAVKGWVDWIRRLFR